MRAFALTHRTGAMGTGRDLAGPRAPLSAPAELSTTALRATTLGVRVKCGGPGSHDLKLPTQDPSSEAKGTSEGTFFGMPMDQKDCTDGTPAVFEFTAVHAVTDQPTSR